MPSVVDISEPRWFHSDYEPVEPFSTWQGTDPQTGIIMLYKRDARGGWVLRYDESTDRWFRASEVMPFNGTPRDAVLIEGELPSLDIGPGAPPSVQEAAAAIVESGMFKPKTEYLIIGDEVPDDSGFAVLDLKKVLGKQTYDDLKQYFTLMPRQMLREFFMKKIWPDLPWDMYTPGVVNGVETRVVGGNQQTVYDTLYGTSHPKKQFEHLVWGAIIDLFNEANLAYINQKQMTAWDWETEKMDAYYVSTSKDAINELQTNIDEFMDVSLALDPKAKEIMEQMKTLTKLGDVGFGIRRQNAIKELLKRRDYASAQAIIDAFRYTQETVLGEQLTKPVPYNIVDRTGETVVAATNGGS